MNTFMRSTGTAILIAAAIQCFTVGVLAPRLPREVCKPGVQEVRTQTYPAVQRIRLKTSEGAVKVSTHEFDEVVMEATIRAYTQHSNTKVMAEQYVKTLLATEVTPEELSVVTEPLERPDEVDLRVDYVFKIPPGVALDIEGMNGNIWVGGGCGDVSVVGNNTDIEVVAPLGKVHARSTNGRIRVYEAADITDVATVNGSVYVHMMGGSLKGETTNGAIVVNLLDPKVEACDLTVVNGGITLVMSEGCSAEVNARTSLGVIKSDLLFAESSKVVRKHALHGAIGEGHTKLEMQSMNGNIWITRSST